MIPLSENPAAAALAPPARPGGGARRPKASPTCVSAGAVFVFLAAWLAWGTGFSQNQPHAPASPLLREGTIHEEDLSIPSREPAPPVRETGPEGNPEPAPRPESSTGGAPAAQPAPAAYPDMEVDRVAFEKPDGSYELPPLGPVTGADLPQRKASMKLVQQGRALLRAAQYKAALGRFEQAIGIDATNPASHYFIARAHYFLKNYRESLSFLDVAELKLGADARWLAEVHVLRARNASAIGFHGRADVNYIRALSLDPRHAFALAQLTTIETVGNTRQDR